MLNESEGDEEKTDIDLLYHIFIYKSICKITENTALNLSEENMEKAEIWRQKITAMLESADVRTLQMVYYFIVGIKKREELLKK